MGSRVGSWGCVSGMGTRCEIGSQGGMWSNWTEEKGRWSLNQQGKVQHQPDEVTGILNSGSMSSGITSGLLISTCTAWVISDLKLWICDFKERKTYLYIQSCTLIGNIIPLSMGYLGSSFLLQSGLLLLKNSCELQPGFNTSIPVLCESLGVVELLFAGWAEQSHD